MRRTHPSKGDCALVPDRVSVKVQLGQVPECDIVLFHLRQELSKDKQHHKPRVDPPVAGPRVLKYMTQQLRSIQAAHRLHECLDALVADVVTGEDQLREGCLRQRTQCPWRMKGGTPSMKGEGTI